jgi:hypothetical protein
MAELESASAMQTLTMKCLHFSTEKSVLPKGKPNACDSHKNQELCTAGRRRYVDNAARRL